MKKKIRMLTCFVIYVGLLEAQNTQVFVYKEVFNSKQAFYYRLIFNQYSSLYLNNRSFEKKTVLKIESPKSINDTLGDSPEKINELIYSSNFNLKKIYFDEEGDALYKNFKDSIILNRRILSSSESLLIYEPKFCKINWLLIDSSKKIGEFICQKAKAEFRGREYEAWYTLKIPVSNGPWKFHGLPGLIIQVKTIDNKYNYEFVNVEKLGTDNIEIKQPLIGKKISIFDLEKESERIREEQNRKLVLEYAQRGLNIKISSKIDNSNRKELNYDDIKK